MKLTYEQIKSITRGAASFLTEGDMIIPRRYTEAQIAYFDTLKGFPVRARCSAGLRFDLVTDSDTLDIELAFGEFYSSRNVTLDIFVDGTMVHTDDIAGREEYCARFEKKGKKRVTVWFPYTVEVKIKSVELSDGATLEPYCDYTKNVLFFGDSITQGCYTTFSANTLANILARNYNWNTVNQGVSGFWFSGEWFDDAFDFAPEMIFAAYGTNDWSLCKDIEKFKASVHSFFAEVTRRYSGVPVVTLLPIWRKDMNNERPYTFHEIRGTIEAIAKEYPNVYVVDAFPFVPHLPEFFGDGNIHPNDLGFFAYADGTSDELRRLGLI